MPAPKSQLPKTQRSSILEALQKAQTVEPAPPAEYEGQRNAIDSFVEAIQGVIGVGRDTKANRFGAMLQAGLPLVGGARGLRHGIGDLLKIANREGVVPLYHGTTAENAAAMLKEGVHLPASGEEAARIVAKKYNIPWTEWMYRVEPQGAGSGYGDAPSRLSTAPYPIASRWGNPESFPQGEIYSDLNSKARMYAAARAQGIPPHKFDDWYEAVYQRQAVSGGSKSQYHHLPDHAGLGSEDLMAQVPEGKVLKAYIDSRAIPEMFRRDASHLLKNIQSERMHPEEALFEWNDSYKDIKIQPKDVKRLHEVDPSDAAKTPIGSTAWGKILKRMPRNY